MVDNTLPRTKNAISRTPIGASKPYTIQIEPIYPQYAQPDRLIKIISYSGGTIWVRGGDTCVVDDDQADQCASGGYLNARPVGGLITLISDQDSVVSIIRRPL